MKKTPAKKKVKVRKVNRKALARRAEKAFNLYRRLQECKEQTGGFDYGICITCEKRLPFDRIQCGHFIHDNANTSHAQFDERNTHNQCCACNTFGHGKLDYYAGYMVKRYGEGIIDELHALKHLSYTNDELQHLLEVYTKKVENILIGG